MQNQVYLDQIMSMPGIEEAKSIVTKWDLTLKKIKNKNVNAFELLPDLFLNSKSGAGKSNFCHNLSNFLEKSGSMDFYGDVKFFEFYFDYCEPEYQLGELSRFVQQLKFSAGYRSEFRGLICIDLTQWESHAKEDHFLTFLDYLSIIDKNCTIVFTADNLKGEQFNELEKVLSSFCRIRSVDFGYPDKMDFAKYISKKLAAYHLNLDSSAEQLLAESIEKLMGSRYFDGYKTIDRLILDISYELMQQANDQDTAITASQLEFFGAQSEFITTLSCAEKIKPMGFHA
ncbi:MAG: hypothetical protein R3Y27_02715 [Clostridia bacterium]